MMKGSRVLMSLLGVVLSMLTITIMSGSGRLAPGALPLAPGLPLKQLVPVRDTSVLESPAVGGQMALRQLILARDPEDTELVTWKSILDRIGTPYDVVFARTDPFEMNRLVRPDGVGRYNAILLTNSALLVADTSGRYGSAFDAAKWSILWDYERVFRVRQVALETSPVVSPEDYGLNVTGEGAIGVTPVYAALASTSSGIFDYLNPSVQIPISGTYIYRSTVAPGSSTRPILTLGSDVLGVLSTSADGRERAALTFSLGANNPASELLGYGLFRWATHGVFLGEQRHWINVDVDDWFNRTAQRRSDGAASVFRLSGPEAASVDKQQTALRDRYPLSREFTLNLAYNAGRFNGGAPAQCDSANTPDSLSSYTRCLVDKFRWINHTLTHPRMNSISYDLSYSEIAENLKAATAIGLPVPVAVLKTPEYSGLGVYSADPEVLDAPVIDHGLAGSNREMLQAASDLGVKYLEGNMSYASHRPSCFNCGIYHPLKPDLFLIPSWPTNIAFEATTPDELTVLYNAVYGKNGTARIHSDRDFSYQEIIDAEADVALRHLMSGSAYAHTLHQGNLHEYAPGKSLTFDWLNALLAKYSSCYSVDLKNPDWLTLAGYVQARNSHFTALATGRDAIWNRVTNTVTYIPAVDSSLFLTGVATRPANAGDQLGPDEAEVYGSDPVARISVTSGSAVTLPASPK